ncbi:hypothetical protein EP331_13400 [bacterium]|nr:MAG: hypothetical protein EP331_13400 [bacterium]
MRYKYLLLLLLIFANHFVQAQSMFPNQRDDSYPLLGLKRAYTAYERAKNEYDRNKQLLEKGLISESQFEQLKSNFFDAEVNYQQSLLVLLFEKQFVSVRKAVKVRDDSGKKRVQITLENTSGLSAEYQHLIPAGDSLFQAMGPETIYNVYVSLSNDQNAIISQPYEKKIPVLEFGKPQTIDFEILQDVDELTVNIIYGNGSTRNPKVFLQKDASMNRVLFQAQQFSQEGELNGSTTFGMDLELFSGENNTYKLEVVNLPLSLNRYFVERGSSTRLSSIRFNESARTRQTDLRVFLPDRVDESIQMDKAIPFFAVAIPVDRLDEFRNLQTKTWTAEELEAKNIGYTRLELIPRGVGRLIVKAPQLFVNGKASEPTQIEFQVKNDGTRTLQNVEFELDVPFGWEFSFSPKRLASLDVREEKSVVLTLTPKNDAGVGRYEARLKTSSVSDNTPIRAEDKIFTFEIPAEASATSTGFLLLLLFVLIGGLVYGGIKLSKK